MSFDYTDIMRERLDALAASISITPGISLRGAIRELEGLRGRSMRFTTMTKQKKHFRFKRFHL